MTATAADVPTRPRRPPRSRFALLGGLAFVIITLVTAWDWEHGIGLSLNTLIENLGRKNSPIEGLLSPDLTRITDSRSRDAFIETLQMAVIATIAGCIVALPIALYSTTTGAPNRPTYYVFKTISNVNRAIPDLLWAMLWVAAVSVGALPGILALFFFSIAVTAKLTSDTVDGIDHGPIEAAKAGGASHTQVLRSAVIPQILPAYTSFVLYSFELNLRSSAVLGLVGAGGIGTVIDLHRNQGQWSAVWGIVVMFYLIVLVVERVSVVLRRRLV